MWGVGIELAGDYEALLSWVFSVYYNEVVNICYFQSGFLVYMFSN